ncbi:MAG: gas vesicle protein GvpJ [bacterium]|nr:gas vesicle protein GvpJ [bacterium]
MEPTAATSCGVVDLLERILDKGLVISADLIISVSGVPLIGINLKAALAGMETMLKYGMMNDWDEATREYAKIEWAKRQKQRVPLVGGEEVFVKMFGSHWYSRGIFRSWQPGHFYVTDKRIFLYRKEPPEVLFEAPYEEIKGMIIERRKNVARKETDYLYLLLKTGEIAQLHPADAEAIKAAVEEKTKARGLELETIPSVPIIDERARKFLMDGEEVTHSGEMWHLLSLLATGGIVSDTWKPGYLYLTNKRLCWWYDFDERIAFETPRDNIVHATVELRDLGSMLKKKKVLAVLHKTSPDNEVACFSTNEEELKDWEAILKEIIRLRSGVAPENTESCPQCGVREIRDILLKEGCPLCGWVPPRLRRQI